MENLKSQDIGKFVADDYRTATVFQNYGIDFCCRGGKTINEVCESKNISADELLTKLNEVSKQSTDQNIDYKSWDLDLLTDYIEKKHHRYVEKTIPVLKQFLEKLCKVHGARHPELFDIKEQFNISAGELSAHMKKEELMLFPYIKKISESKNESGQRLNPGNGSVQNPINIMMKEHTIEGDRFSKIAELSDNYTAPADGCTTYNVAFEMLKDFEEDLHMHVHLENNILFPGAIKLEKELC
ncbi:MAG: iron-sulfur cluster repair di-iron protein [Bacteroidota bacterium]|nr:iron-sulfur cluster repair di-iron protein [Bacteroidota bacterium]